MGPIFELLKNPPLFVPNLQQGGGVLNINTPDLSLTRRRNNINSYNNYAYSLVERNERLVFALQIAMKAINLVPGNAAYLDTYGWILFKLGKVGEAMNYIQNSIELEASNAVVLEHLGDVLMSANREKDALEYYRKAFEFDKNNNTLKNKAYPE